MLVCCLAYMYCCGGVGAGEPTVLRFGVAGNGVLCCKAIKPRDA